MRCACMVLLLFFFCDVLADVSEISVKKIVTFEASVSINGTVSRGRLSEVLLQLKDTVCSPGEACVESNSSHEETTSRRYNYPSGRSGTYPTHRPYYYTTSYYYNRPYYYTGSGNSNRPYGTTRSPDYYNRSYRSTRFPDYFTTRKTWTTPAYPEERFYDCSELPDFSPSGLYNISTAVGQVEVYCDTLTDGGNWTVIQSYNTSSLLDFDKSWREYKLGFGIAKEAYWLGNKYISAITKKGDYTLRIDMVDEDGGYTSAVYEHFRVLPEYRRFRLEVEGYSGNSGDGLSDHNLEPFSTRDQGRNSSCSITYGGGWWYLHDSCFQSNLNTNPPIWLNTSLLATEMKIRPYF